MTFALDTETTGGDVYHASRPYFVTIANDEGTQSFYEWEVDPLTRIPIIPPEDVKELNDKLKVVANWSTINDEEIHQRHMIVGQNIRFDTKMLEAVGIGPWPWDMTHDTLIASHILASNHKHDLTALAIQYLGEDIEPHEKALHEACEKCRRYCRYHLPKWFISKEGAEGMPSAKAACWKADGWLPRTLAIHLKYPEPDPECIHQWGTAKANESICLKCDGHRWYVVLQDYANADSAATLLIWQEMERKLKEQDLWDIYLYRMKLPSICSDMERRGMTVNGNRFQELMTKYEAETEHASNTCTGIASSCGYDLKLPKSNRNDSLIRFCFGEPDVVSPRFPSKPNKWLNLPIVNRTDTGNPSLDSKVAIPTYLTTLPPRSKQLVFVEALSNRSKFMKAISALETYAKFWLPIPDDGPDIWYVIHPSFNITGTVTTRSSSSNPNNQNVSRKEEANLRYIFGPRPGRVWYDLDYENIELRIPAYISNERTMIELFEKPDEPPYFGSYHLLNASIIHPDEFWPLADKEGAFKKRHPDMYRSTKNFGFSFQYSGGRVTCDLAARKSGAYDLVKNNLKNLTRLTQQCIAYANKYGYVETLPDKTVNPRRGYPLLCARTEYGGILPTTPLSYKVQGTAGWAKIKGQVRCHEQLEQWNIEEQREEGDGYYLIAEVHDSLVFDFPEDGIDNVGKVRTLQYLMQQSGDDIGVPLRVSIGFHPHNWAEEQPLPTKEKEECLTSA